MGRAIVRVPQVYLMDEPLSNLDAKLRSQTRSEIIELQERLATTTVYVTHDQVEAMTMGHRVAVMRDGELQQIGTPREIYAQPEDVFVATFVGAPPMAMLSCPVDPSGTVTVGSLRFDVGSERLGGAVAAGSVLVGVRAEDWRHAEDSAGVRATVTQIEDLGADTYVHAVVDEGDEQVLLTASRLSGPEPKPGEVLMLAQPGEAPPVLSGGQQAPPRQRPMRVLTVLHADSGAALGADLIAELVADSPDAVLGFATGSTPEPLYAELALRCRRGLDLRGVHGFLLDEYAGLPPDHPQSYRQVIRREVTDRLGLDTAQISGPDGTAFDLDDAARRYEQEITDAGGVDLQILGLGANGHIGFNEPGSSFDSQTRVVSLTEQTRSDNARFFGGDVDGEPRQAITQGLATIARARRLVLLAWGEHKAKAAARAIEGEVTERWPATMLQTHADVTVILDHAAAALLRSTSIDSFGSLHAER